jgi:hypothetical protein
MTKRRGRPSKPGSSVWVAYEVQPLVDAIKTGNRELALKLFTSWMAGEKIFGDGVDDANKHDVN